VAGDRREVPLGDGGAVVVRPARSSDVDGVAALFAGLELADRYRRFFSAYRPDRRFVESLVGTTPEQGVQLVAVVVPSRGDDDGRIVAEAGYRLLPDGDGELGITVAADWRGWLGPFLLDALASAAAGRGVPNLEADVLLENRAMLALLHARGDALLSHDDASSVRVLISTAGDTPTWPPAAAPGRILVESPGHAWAGAAEARRRGLSVISCPGPTSRRRACPALEGRPCPLAATADAIVVSRPPADDRWAALPAAHRRVHAGVPVCLEVAGRSGPDGDDAAPARAELLDRVAQMARPASPPPPSR
jgi:hypothetical protein